MTWGEWVESEYNTHAYYITGDEIVSAGQRVFYDDTRVKTTDIIIANRAYLVGEGVHGGGTN